MTLNLGVITFLTLSAFQLSATGYEHDLKLRRWLNDEDPDGTFDAKLKPLNIEESSDYGGRLWPSKNRQHSRSSRNSTYKLTQNWPDPSKKLGQLSAVSIDADGNIVVFHRGDRVWDDVALHQVFKFPPGGSTKPLLTLGVAFVPDNDDVHFCKPTAVAVMSNGDFFVSDDRENGRIQCFNCHNGTFLKQFYSREMGSRLFSVAYSPAKGGLLYVVNGPEFGGKGIVRGFVISLTMSDIVEEFSPAETGFSNPHDVAVSQDAREVYVVELSPFKVWQFINGNINNTTVVSADTVLSEMEVVKVPLNSNPTSTIATVVAIVIGIVAVVAVVIFAAVLKMRKRGGSADSIDDLEYSKLVEIKAVTTMKCGILFLLLHIAEKNKYMFCSLAHSEGFKLGQFLDRHQGFEKVSTEESDEESPNNHGQGSQFA
ncbi:Peptidyl-alpha-hydroxyglycine alpha-amidating lyase 1 [Blattella germanica]|nr:Peptidyl-alpha-hydroxyglycine alpha-amidating lyase 1 [Blattella germanica]